MSEAGSGVCPFNVGERFEKAISLDAPTISRFAAFMGDTNPLHHDMELAKKSKFGTIIASGSQTIGLIGSMCAGIVTERCNSVGLEMSFRFRRAVLADAPMRMVLQVTGVEAKPGKGHIVTFSGEMLDAKGEVALTGFAKTLVFKDVPTK